MPYFDDVLEIYEEWKKKYENTGTKLSWRICELLQEDLEKK